MGHQRKSRNTKLFHGGRAAEVDTVQICRKWIRALERLGSKLASEVVQQSIISSAVGKQNSPGVEQGKEHQLKHFRGRWCPLKVSFKSSLDLSKANRRIIPYLTYFSGENGALSVLEQNKITPSPQCNFPTNFFPF